MGERYYAWDEVSDGLMLISVTKAEDEQVKRRKKQTIDEDVSPEFHCPHAYLILSYQETLNDSEKMKFRRHYLRKVMPSEPDVIILQDIKDLVLFLLVTSVSPQFINFLHLPIVDRFLRALILYFQHYVEIWQDLMHERAATMMKAPNPLARGHRTKYAEDLQSLRWVLGREYVDLLLGCQGGPQYHHMMTTKKQTSIMRSQGEKDLRIFEALISVSHRVVWIALQRKHYTLIELELHRLFRTEAYNTAQRQSGSKLIQDMLEDDIRVLHGTEKTLKSRLLRNSILPHTLMYTDCDYRLLSLGIVDVDVEDLRIVHIRDALLVQEDLLPQLGIKVGILGHNRSDYDIMLAPIEEPEEAEEISPIMQESITTDILEMGLPSYEYEYELIHEFPVKSITLTEKYDKIRKQARKRWICREVKRRHHKSSDLHSVTTID